MLNVSNEFESQQPVMIPAQTTLRPSSGSGRNDREKDDLDEHLLRLVFARPHLYNFSLPIVERKSLSNTLWKEVADELAGKYGPIDINYIKTRYKYHKDKYTRYRSVITTRKNESPQETSSKIYVPKHIKILCKLDTLNKSSETMITNICRTCLIEKSNMESIYSMQPVNNETVKVSYMISMCTGLEMSQYDNWSNLICDLCINSITLAYEFRTRCWDSQKFLFKSTQTLTDPKPLSLPSKKRKMDVFINKPEIGEFTQTPTDPKPQLSASKKRKMIELNYKLEINNKLKEHADITLDDTAFRGKRYKCRHCEQRYLAAHLMIDHLENIHKFNIKPKNWMPSKRYNCNKIICQQCGIALPKGNAFADHYRRHTGEKPFKCDKCDFRSAYLSSLKKHKLTHTGEKPVLCHICGQAYRTSSNRSRHIRMSHTNETPYKCLICDKGFKSNAILKGHMQTHEPSKMFECEICKRKFSQKGPYRVHMMQHTGRRPHKCSECGKGFIQRHCWRTHMKTHHKITVQ